jgi:hypothetical protein
VAGDIVHDPFTVFHTGDAAKCGFCLKGRNFLGRFPGRL